MEASAQFHAAAALPLKWIPGIRLIGGAQTQSQLRSSIEEKNLLSLLGI